MSRQSVAPGRNLSLTEELERLEQSITLTLQEIDSNFSKAHRIVTTSILPIVEQYAQHSQDVWEGSKFWKHFFEASANVSLSGYEEPALDDDATYTATTDHESTLATPPRASNGGELDDESAELDHGEDESSLLLDSPSNATGVHSTPRLASSGKKAIRSPPPSRQRTAKLPSRPRFTEDDEPSTPRPRAAMDQEGGSSPFDPPSAFQPSTAQRTNNDPLLHRVLDKTYRVAATPHSTRRIHGLQDASAAKTTATPSAGREKTFNFDSSPMSSPAIAPPQLRSDLFSPAKGPRTPRSAAPATRYTSTGKPVSFPSASKAKALRTPALWDSDSGSSDGEGGYDMSPPKTMQFAIPQGKLVATPAREASRRIVADLLASAGGAWEDEGTEELEAPSPTVVRGIEEDDTF